jgi:periplasmic protein TonB
MGQAARLLPPDDTPAGPRTPTPFRSRRSTPRFEDLLDSALLRRRASSRLPVTWSIAAHAVLITAIALIPLFSDEIPPAADNALRAFFAMPVAAPPPPPPPPPPAAGAARVVKAPAVARPPDPARFVAPVEIPEAIAPEESLSLGVDGGVPGGVEGGVPGGVVGGIVGGLPAETPPPPARVVRVGGQIKAPRLLKNVAPEYPELAARAGLNALVILELRVSETGVVLSSQILRGHPLFDDAALEAVRQWRYAPLLLNGVATPFVVNVTVNFRLNRQPTAEL